MTEPASQHQGNATNRSAFIVCDNLVKIYQVAELEVVALQGLDLVVSGGEILGLIGVSGSGKSTLMNILGGLDRPSAGRVWVDGGDLLKMSDTALDQYRRSKVGFLWQQVGRNLIPYLNALENVILPMTLAGEVGREKTRRAEALLEAVSLSDRKHHHLTELSGGEQQRVALAVALANNPRLLLADEPTGELDEANSFSIYKTIRALNEEFGLTTLIVSHDPGLARHVDRVVAIRDGKLASETVRQPTPTQFVNQDQPGSLEGEHEEQFEELTVLDSAGRLQVPKAYLEQFEINRRVRLELTADGILIKPVEHPEGGPTAEVLASELVEAQKSKGLKGLIKRWRSRREKRGKGSGE